MTLMTWSTSLLMMSAVLAFQRKATGGIGCFQLILRI